MSVRVPGSLESTVQHVRSALSAEGFGVLSEIDIAATFKAKLGVDVAPQIILGACNAPLAREGLSVEPDLGLLLPCNVVVRVDDEGQTVVAAVNPEMFLTVSGRSELEPIALDAGARLRRVLAAVAAGAE
jgi:uncharacterized protein (DUF302 family)